VRERAEDDVVEGLTGRGGRGLDRVPDLVRHPKEEHGARPGERALAPAGAVLDAEGIC
jgi:hypothetical protein